MQLLHLLSLLLVALLACASAQICRGSPRIPSCRGARNIGRGSRRCRPIIMWYYDAGSRQCREFRYLCTRGNNNRWCTRALCEQNCH